MSLNDNLKMLRTEKGLTQEQLAGKLGVSPQAVSKWETAGSYPDSALLVSIADALGVSLDVLFGHRVYSMEDISARLQGLIVHAAGKDRFHIIRDLCWQMEKAFIREEPYDPEDIRSRDASSYVRNDHGFTHVSNGRAPFFSVFPQYGDNYTEVIGDGEEMRQLFEILASPDTMKAVLFVHRHPWGYLFEKEALAAACGIEEEKLDQVMEGLFDLDIVQQTEAGIDGKPHVLYCAKPSHKLIALLLFAHELNYRGYYCAQCDHRMKPYLK